LATGRVERRLAAILAADVAGYSRLMSADEEGTHERLKAHLRALVNPKISELHGRLIKSTGDGLLAEFPSAVNAVRCAVEIQRTMIDRNADTPDDKRISFRIGVNLGDVIIEPEDVFGDDVNIASRLEALAEPGGTCISRAVRDRIGERLPYSFDDIGEHSVKNISRPVHVYTMSAAAIASLPPLPIPAEARTQVTVSTAPRLSIAVLPFTNLSNDPEQEYFADGITDDLTADLSRVSGSFVIARNTAFTYKGRSVDVKQVGRELGVRYVLEGSVRRADDQVRINVQLIDAQSGAHVWADRFELDRAHVWQAQDEITGRLARSLDLELVKDVSRRIEREGAVNPAAFDLVLRGRAALSKSASSTAWEAGLRYFEQALQIDSQLVDAKVGIANALVNTVVDGWSTSVEEDLARAEQLLLEALEIGSDNALAHLELGRIRRVQNRLFESKIEFETTVALDRNSVFGLRHLGQALMCLGYPKAGIPYIEKALRLSPRDPNVASIYWALGMCHLLLGHDDQATDFLRRARAANPRWWWTHFCLAGALGIRGELDEARAALADGIKLKPEVTSVVQWRIYQPWQWMLRERTLVVGLHKAGLPDE
jgi:TolB-like protein/class 3 adenylate cyclase